jgi:polyferredoxin/tetratricopeptide (TPR) repeat protein
MAPWRSTSSDALPNTAGGVVLSLPVLDPDRFNAARRRVRRLARWRASAMIAVYILMVAHIVHWSITGRSIGRFVMSDSMETLELGRINPGFILFAAALLVSLVCGRFLCGWVCHMGALQELCAWILRRLGIRPRMFHSRLLGYVPIVMALGMFVWPTLKREAVVPAMDRWWPQAAPLVGAAQPFPGWAADLATDSFWDGLPPAAVAIPFLLLCGFATVYFLGARGLCRYGCPYGGLLQPIERFAPARVTVDMAKCTQCGLCTAACTAQVRVHDEVRLHGRVVDRNCVRSLDCLAACPENALSFTFGRPGWRRPGPSVAAVGGYKLRLSEELLVAVVFGLVFLVTRGLYGAVPMLMAATLGVLGAFVVWRAVRLFRERDARHGGVQLRRRGRFTPVGWTALAGVVLLAVVFAHSAFIRAVQWQAGRLDDRVTITFDTALAPAAPILAPEMKQAAEEALRLYTLASGPARGGVGFVDTPPVNVRMAWLALTLGDRQRAADELGRLLAAERPNDQLGVQRARIQLALNHPDQAEQTLRDVCERRPTAGGSRDLLCRLLAGSGRAVEAESILRDRIRRDPDDVAALSSLGRLYLAMGRPADALPVLRTAVADEPRVGMFHMDLAAALFTTGDAPAAIAQLEIAAAEPHLRSTALDWGEQMLRASGRGDEVASWRRRMELAGSKAPSTRVH